MDDARAPDLDFAIEELEPRHAATHGAHLLGSGGLGMGSGTARITGAVTGTATLRGSGGGSGGGSGT